MANQLMAARSRSIWRALAKSGRAVVAVAAASTAEAEVEVEVEAVAIATNLDSNHFPDPLTRSGKNFPSLVKSSMAYTRKLNPRMEHRLHQAEIINSSATLAEKYPNLKSLRVDLTYMDSEGGARSGGMKYKVNLEHAKSRFYFNCVQSDCVGGDYDLTEKLAEAIAKKRKL